VSRRPNRVADALVDWIPLVDPSGPFLTLPVLKRAFPHGMDRVSADVRAEMRQRFDALGPAPADRAAWLRWVLVDLLEYGGLLREGPAIPDALQHVVPEHGVMLRPDFVLVGAPEPGATAGRARLLIEAYPVGTDFTKRLPDQRWTATPVERMALLCRATGVEMGLVTDTNAFTLVWAPHGGSTATATWLAGLWSEERGLFDAFTSLLGARRFFAVAPVDTLEALFAESARAQVEVTNQLGKQVRQAVELLVDAFSRANRESGGQLLDDLGAGDLETAAEQVYGAAVTVMMRLVFLLCAEERRLFPVGDALYDASYAVSTLLDALREEASLSGEETLERRTAAWHRLLATFRLVHDGVQHETLRIPAYGGGLFDPDRFPFLEGRRPGQAAGAGTATPPAVSDRSVMAILDALQYLSFKGETRRVSYRSLDVEQIGHVYEGLLDHGCQIVDEIVLGLDGKEEPELPLAALESAAAQGRDALVAYVQDQTGRSGGPAIAKDLDRGLDADTRRYLVEACENDPAVFARVAPFVGLLRRDLRGLPVVFLPGSVCVTQTSSRRDSGTEYTTRELADEVVRYTLEPLVYSPGPQDGVPPEDWKPRTSAEILALRVCDPAVGSGAILVAACRYLAERLAEAWTAEGALPADAVGDLEALTVAARRAVVDHCLFGVDRNPMAAEMAKLSLWLVTMAKERPFSFLDHAIQSGDSLLGITSLGQVEHLHMDPERGAHLHGDFWGYTSNVAPAVQRAAELRESLATFAVVTVRDAEQKAAMHAEATRLTADLVLAADLVVGAGLVAAAEGATAGEELLLRAAPSLARLVRSSVDATERVSLERALRDDAADWLDRGRPAAAPDRIPLHWPLAFPEVFLNGARRGFDALIGNPPFRAGKKISGPNGKDYREFIVQHVAEGRKGNADLVTYFFCIAPRLLAPGGTVGFLATNSIGQGEARKVGFDALTTAGMSIYRAEKSREWPGGASVYISMVWLRLGPWDGTYVLDGTEERGITASLDPLARVSGAAYALAANRGRAFQGSIVLNDGLLLSPQEAHDLLTRHPGHSRVVLPFVIGEELNEWFGEPEPERWVICFADLDAGTAQQYPEAWSIAERRALPEAQKKDKKTYAQLHRYWWRFWRYRAPMYRAIEGHDRVLVIAATSKTAMPTFLPNDMVYSHALAVFAANDDFHLGVLSSSVHWLWAVRKSSMKADFRYTPSDAFETFAFPDVSSPVAAAARCLHDVRHGWMTHLQLGLTPLYARVHDPDDAGEPATTIRVLHERLDRAVCDAYGWTDLALEHGVFATKHGTRFTVRPDIGAEIHDRLLELNHARYAEEVRLGLHEPAGGRGAAKHPARAAKLEAPVQGDLLASLAPARPTTSRTRS
jgi:hypothetical protein